MTSRTRTRTAGQLQVFIMILAALGVAAVGVVASLTVRQLGRSADDATSLQLGLRQYQEALLARSAIDTDILRAASSAEGAAAAADAAPRVAEVRLHLAEARHHYEQAQAPEALFTSFDLVADSLIRYSTTAGTLANELVNDPAVAPGHLIELQSIATMLDERQTDLANEVERVTNEAQRTTRQSVRDALVRTAATSAAGVLALVLLTIRIDRRVKRNHAARRAAQEESANANALLVEQVGRQRFAEDLREALDGASDEPAIFDVVGRALDLVPSAGVSELLLADSSHAHVRRVAATSSAPGCGVDSPWDCPAVRRGATLVFESSESLRACPKLRGRPEGAISATCVPLLFNGRGMGMVHSVGREGEVKPPLAEAQLKAVAAESATRIGTVRVLHKNEFQARIDGLTGMLNRRSLEDRLRGLVEAAAPFTLAMVDLDHFKQLNDRYGHEGGDRALRVFSAAAHETLRAGDPVGRYGGEEFVFAFPDQSKAEALAAIERVRAALVVATASGACPPFTASFGVAEWHQGMSVDEVMRTADARLLRAKRLGRNCVVDDDEPVVAEQGSPAAAR